MVSQREQAPSIERLIEITESLSAIVAAENIALANGDSAESLSHAPEKAQLADDFHKCVRSISQNRNAALRACPDQLSDLRMIVEEFHARISRQSKIMIG